MVERKNIKKIKALQGHSEEPNEYMSFGVHKTFDEESLSSRSDFEQNPSQRGNHERRSSDECVRSEKKETDKSLYIYDICDIHSSSIKNLLERTHTEIKIGRCITVSPTLWKLFKEWVRRTDPLSNASEKLCQFMYRFVYEAIEGRHQPKITQFFINKPAQVNIAKNQIVVQEKSRERPDYANLTDEELEAEYQRANMMHDYSGKMLAAHERNERRKRRGL